MLARRQLVDAEWWFHLRLGGRRRGIERSGDVIAAVRDGDADGAARDRDVGVGHEECVQRDDLLAELGEGDALGGVEREDTTEEVLGLARHGEEVAEEVLVGQELAEAVIRGHRFLPRAAICDHID